MEPDEELRAILCNKGTDIPKTRLVSVLGVLPCPISFADRRSPFKSLRRSAPLVQKDDENFLDTLRYLLVKIKVDPSQYRRIETLLLTKRNYGVILSPENETYISSVTALIESYVHEVADIHQ